MAPVSKIKFDLIPIGPKKSISTDQAALLSSKSEVDLRPKNTILEQNSLASLHETKQQSSDSTVSDAKKAFKLPSLRLKLPPID